MTTKKDWSDGAASSSSSAVSRGNSLLTDAEEGGEENERQRRVSGSIFSLQELLSVLFPGSRSNVDHSRKSQRQRQCRGQDGDGREERKSAPCGVRLNFNSSAAKDYILSILIALLDSDVGSAFLAIPDGEGRRGARHSKFMDHLVRRTFFVFVPAAVCVLLIFWGKLSRPFCNTGVGPATCWYFLNYLLVSYPLCTLQGEADKKRKKREAMVPLRWSRGLVAALFVLSCSISSIESILSSIASTWFARSAAITVHTLTCLVVIPSMFRSRRSMDAVPSGSVTKGGPTPSHHLPKSLQKRRTQSDYRLVGTSAWRPRVLSEHNDKTTSSESSENDFSDEMAVARQRGASWGEAKEVLSHMWHQTSHKLNAAAAASLLFGSTTYRWMQRGGDGLNLSTPHSSADDTDSEDLDDLETGRDAAMSSWGGNVNLGSSTSIADLTFFFLGLSLVTSFIQSPTEASARTYYYSVSLTLFFFFFVTALIVYRDRKKRLRFSFAYLTFYIVISTRLPDFLGNATFHTFVNLEHAAGLRFEKYSEIAERLHVSQDMSRYFVSLGYMVTMAIYIRILRAVVSNLSAPNLFARFLFQAQLYSYFFYYMLISATRNIDALFWAMLISINANYIMSNTKLYDVARGWLYRKYMIVYSSTGRSIYKMMRRCLGVNRRTRANTITLGASASDGSATDAVERVSRKNVEGSESRLLALLFQIKIADQDALADTTALVAIPIIITALAFFELLSSTSGSSLQKLFQHMTTASVSTGNTAALMAAVEIAPNSSSTSSSSQTLDLSNLWLRFGIMFLARLVSSRVSRLIFSYRLNVMRETLKEKSNEPALLSDAVQKSLWMAYLWRSRKHSTSALELAAAAARSAPGESGSKKGSVIATYRDRAVATHAIIVNEFRESFPYFVVVACLCGFSCLQRYDVPVRYAFC